MPAGNALVEGATFIAILLGTIVGGLAAKGGGDPASFAGLMMVFALLCWTSSLFIPEVGEGAPRSEDLAQHRRLHRGDCSAICAPTAGCGGARW